MASIVRSMARSIARDNMRKAGYTKVVKSGFFMEHWKEFVTLRRNKGRRRNGNS